MTARIGDLVRFTVQYVCEEGDDGAQPIVTPHGNTIHVRDGESQGIVIEVREKGHVFVKEASTYVGSIGDTHWTRTHLLEVAPKRIISITPQA